MNLLKTISLRNRIVVGVVAGLLGAGFHNTAQADNFTNGNFITYIQEEWGDNPTPTNAAGLLSANYDSVYASTLGAVEVGLTGAEGFSIVFTDAPYLLAYLHA
jgi:hypothetical protein